MSAAVRLPWELIIKIISYTLDPSARPYLADIKLTMDITMTHGVKVGLRHIRTIKALKNAYSTYMEPPSFLGGLYDDCWHITNTVYS